MIEKKIQIGDIVLDKVTHKQQSITVSNRTKKYILPCLRDYGQEFVTKLGAVWKVAVGIGDIVVQNRGLKHEKHVFILLDTEVAVPHFKKFIAWIRDQPMYETDYVYDYILKTRYHMVVIKLPEKFYPAFDLFKEGKYSQMFSKENIDHLFEKHPDIVKVFVKDHQYKVYFTEQVNEEYNLTGQYRLTPEDWEAWCEIDFPPKSEEETFNHHLKPNTNGINGNEEQH